MNDIEIPPFCIPCIARFSCPHLRTNSEGGLHYANGEVWDDFREVCLDCGVDLSQSPSSSVDDIPF